MTSYTCPEKHEAFSRNYHVIVNFEMNNACQYKIKCYISRLIMYHYILHSIKLSIKTQSNIKKDKLLIDKFFLDEIHINRVINNPNKLN